MRYEMQCLHGHSLLVDILLMLINLAGSCAVVRLSCNGGCIDQHDSRRPAAGSSCEAGGPPGAPAADDPRCESTHPSAVLPAFHGRRQRADPVGRMEIQGLQLGPGDADHTAGGCGMAGGLL